MPFENVIISKEEIKRKKRKRAIIVFGFIIVTIISIAGYFYFFGYVYLKLEVIGGELDEYKSGDSITFRLTVTNYSFQEFTPPAIFNEFYVCPDEEWKTLNSGYLTTSVIGIDTDPIDFWKTKKPISVFESEVQTFSYKLVDDVAIYSDELEVHEGENKVRAYIWGKHSNPVIFNISSDKLMSEEMKKRILLIDFADLYFDENQATEFVSSYGGELIKRKTPYNFNQRNWAYFRDTEIENIKIVEEDMENAKQTELKRRGEIGFSTQIEYLPETESICDKFFDSYNDVIN